MKNFLNVCQNVTLSSALKLLALWQPFREKMLSRCKPLLEKIYRLWLPEQEKLKRWLKPQQEKLSLRWQSLAKREKQSVLVGAGLSALLLFYLLLWSPLNAHLDELRAQIQHEKNTAAWIKAADKQIKAYTAKSSPLKVKPLRLNALQEKIRQAPINQYLNQLTQEGNNEIHCSFNQIDFDTLITWLIDFSQQENLFIKQAVVHRVNNVGTVQAEFVFQVG